MELSINIYQYVCWYKLCTLLLNIDNDTLPFNTSGKEFQVIIPLWRTQYIVLDEFTRKTRISLLDLVLWLWIWLLTSKCYSISSSILKSNNYNKCSSKLEDLLISIQYKSCQTLLHIFLHNLFDEIRNVGTLYIECPYGARNYNTK